MKEEKNEKQDVKVEVSINNGNEVSSENEDTKVTVKINDKKGKIGGKNLIPDDILKKIPRPGESIFIVSPYPVDDNDDLEEDEFLPRKEKTIVAYSYEPVMVKASVLNDSFDEVLVNGDYNIPLYKNNLDSSKKVLIFTNEEEAEDKWLALTTASIKIAERYTKRANYILDYLKTSKKELHH
jgi:hypothetical protein